MPIQANVNYLAPTLPSSLRRTGRHLMKRDASGSDSGLEGVEFERRRVSIDDGRSEGPGGRPTLEAQGFELLTDPLADPSLDFLDSDAVVGRYYRECAELVAKSTGAVEVHAFDHNVRSVAGKQGGQRLAGGQEVQGPARVVHGDYTLTSAPQRLRDLASPPAENDTYVPLLDGRETLLDAGRVEEAIARGRYAFINVWRNIDDAPVQSDPMVLCDAQSVAPEDLVVFEIHYSDRIGENYWAKPADRHHWVTFPEMTRDEALLIKQWDSAGPMARSEGESGDASDPDAPCSFSFHTAYFDEATMAGKPPRWSIEVRCVAFYGDAP